MNEREFLIVMCDEKFTDEDANEEGFEFTEFYFQAEDDGFFDDYERVLGQGLPSVYHGENTWENYNKIAFLLSKLIIAGKLTDQIN